MQLYLPDEVNDNQCAYVVDNDTIRVYDNKPSYNSDINYTDYYYNSHYVSKRGSTHFSQYSALPVCDSTSRYTTDIYYRFDMPSILIYFWFLLFFIIWLPLKLFMRLFRRFNP